MADALQAPGIDVTYRVGIDVGGTFTDLFVWSSDGEVRSLKVLTTPRDPSVGLLDGLTRLGAERGFDLPAFARRLRAIVHGTTVTTNAMLTRRGARTGLLTTAGVRDALEMRRGIRESQYDNRARNVVPLVPRHLRLPARGRIDAAGAEVEALSQDDVREAARAFRAAGVESVAVCFLNSFANPAHERAAAEIVRAEMPGAFVSVSSEILPTIRFYNRVSTTVLDACSGPVLRGYIGALTRRLGESGFAGVLLIMQSSGDVAAPELILKSPSTTLLSGPAAGPRAGLAFIEQGVGSQPHPAHADMRGDPGPLAPPRPPLAPRGEAALRSPHGTPDPSPHTAILGGSGTAPHGERRCLVVDMGGTSFDASLVQDGRVALRSEGEIDRLRIALPMLDIVSIGAGGGSLGWIDGGGLLRMGPQSAGSEPGPACYGRGGDRPACTDADLLLGYIDADFFAGGRLRLDAGRARAAIERHVARPLGLPVEEAAAGMYRVINANMAHGVREITVKRGLDPREFPMVVAGGAGPLHACAIAAELEIPTVVVPFAASVLCASGMLLADLGHDFVRSYVVPFAAADPDRLRRLVVEMTAEGEAQLRREGMDAGRIRHEVALDLRYLKQYHEVTVPVARELVDRDERAAIAAAFHAEHDRLYGYELGAEGTGLELINVRVRSLGQTDKPSLPMIATGADTPPGHARKGTRRAFVPERGCFENLPVWDGHGLLAGNRIPGPALVDRVDTTVFVSAGFDAGVDRHGTLMLRARGKGTVQP